MKGEDAPSISRVGDAGVAEFCRMELSLLLDPLAIEEGVQTPDIRASVAADEHRGLCLAEPVDILAAATDATDRQHT